MIPKIHKWLKRDESYQGEIQISSIKEKLKSSLWQKCERRRNHKYVNKTILRKVKIRQYKSNQKLRNGKSDPA